MYSFLFGVAPEGQAESLRSSVEASLAGVRKLMPAFDVALESESIHVPEVCGRGFVIRPTESSVDPLVSWAATPETAALVFGRVRRAPSAAASVLSAWEDGETAVRRLDGNFGALIVDRRKRELTLLSDVLGLRALRYLEGGEFFFVSPHDLALVATSRCTPSLNRNAVASLLLCDWSLGGDPLVEDLRACDPREVLRWTHGRLQRESSPLISLEDRIDARDRRSVSAHLDEMIDDLRASAREVCGDASEVSLDLTAGMDSRATAAILAATIPRERIVANTGGAPSNFEVRTARKIAARYGLRHRSFVGGPANADDFAEYTRYLTFFSNGEANCKRASGSAPRGEPRGGPSFNGNGGALYRTYYVPKGLRPERFAAMGVSEIMARLQRKLRRFDLLPWSDPQYPDGLRSRMRNILEGFAAVTADPTDVFGLFFLTERYCRWGSLPTRMPTNSHRHCLYNNPVLLTKAYRLPAPAFSHALLHRRIIRKLMPRAYLIPVNRSQLLPLYDDLRRLHRVSRFLLQRAERADARKVSAETMTHQDMMGDLFARSPLREVVRDLLLDTRSATCEVLDRKGLEQMLREHDVGERDHIDSLGLMVSVEQWRRLVEEASALGRAASASG